MTPDNGSTSKILVPVELICWLLTRAACSKQKGRLASVENALCLLTYIPAESVGLYMYSLQPVMLIGSQHVAGYLEPKLGAGECSLTFDYK